MNSLHPLSRTKKTGTFHPCLSTKSSTSYLSQVLSHRYSFTSNLSQVFFRRYYLQVILLLYFLPVSSGGHFKIS